MSSTTASKLTGSHLLGAISVLRTLLLSIIYIYDLSPNLLLARDFIDSRTFSTSVPAGGFSHEFESKLAFFGTPKAVQDEDTLKITIRPKFAHLIKDFLSSCK
jgi:hypothetical protein